MARHPIRFTPLHLAGALFLLAGLVLAVYHGLEQFNFVPRIGWILWSHIHFVTIGGFTQLLFGMLPQLTARKLEHSLPSKYYDWLNFIGLNGGFLLLWYGRGWGHTWAFDGGLIAIWLLVAGLLVVMLRMVMQSDRAWHATTGLYLVSVFVFLWGITYAYGLFAHVWQVSGGWLGLREAHVHANAWGFLGLAAIGTLYDLSLACSVPISTVRGYLPGALELPSDGGMAVTAWVGKTEWRAERLGPLRRSDEMLRTPLNGALLRHSCSTLSIYSSIEQSAGTMSSRCRFSANATAVVSSRTPILIDDENSLTVPDDRRRCCSSR